MAVAKDRGRLRLARRDAEAGRIPWRIRLKAWWEGYEIQLPDLKKPAAETPVPKHDVRAPDAKLPWDDARIGLVQELWGKGFDRPGGPDAVVEMVKPFGLDRSMSIVELGAGLGGATRAICKEFEVWITGLEADQNLARVGNELSNIAGLGKKAPIEHASLESPELKAGGYNCVFAKEAFVGVPDKTALLDEIEKALKPRGQLLFTDYVLADDVDPGEAVKDWREGEPISPAPWRPQDYRDTLDDLRLDIRIAEDVTDRQIDAIKHGWAEYMTRAKHGEVEEVDGQIVMEETALWTRRLKALESGALRVYRFHALKSGEGQTLSDW